jgi:hypothetical protein
MLRDLTRVVLFSETWVHSRTVVEGLETTEAVAMSSRLTTVGRV